MDFGNAIRELKNGKSLYRKGWNGKNICIKLMKASDSLDMTQDYIYIDTTDLKTSNRDAPKSKVPWLASQTDMLADDWEAFDDALVKETNADKIIDWEVVNDALISLTSAGKIIFNDINGVRREESAKKLINVEIERDDGEADYKVRFVDNIGWIPYHINKDTYDAFVKIIKKSWHLYVE